ncbi:unnamed protein product [Tenebrio molitor]|nr:unnamed protein product [Tenebrio molitor]
MFHNFAFSVIRFNTFLTTLSCFYIGILLVFFISHF